MLNSSNTITYPKKNVANSEKPQLLLYFQLYIFKHFTIQNNHFINLVKEVPVEFCGQRLDTVNLSDNYLENLPDEFGEMPLISVWLSNNKFQEFPNCLTQLRRLGTLDIANNHIRSLPDRVISF